ncbi:hypothetical protein PMIN04_012211 [Paraphaeosphaeria minitans]
MLPSGEAGRTAQLNARVIKNSFLDEAKADHYGLSRPFDPTNEGASRTLNPGITITATELLTREKTEDIYRRLDQKKGLLHNQSGELDRVQDNIRNIALIGQPRFVDVPFTTQTIGGFDATNYPAGTPNYDHIIFDNPHTGVYGSPSDDVQNMQAVNSNKGLLEAVMTEARRHLTTNGLFELSVCGWPFLSKPSRQKDWDVGMDLANEEAARAFAGNISMRLVSIEDKGFQSVTRNNGDVFQAQVVRLCFARA